MRYTEHAIQAIADRQTQMLPDNQQDQARIAFMIGVVELPKKFRYVDDEDEQMVDSLRSTTAFTP